MLLGPGHTQDYRVGLQAPAGDKRTARAGSFTPVEPNRHGVDREGDCRGRGQGPVEERVVALGIPRFSDEGEPCSQGREEGAPDGRRLPGSQ